MAEEFKVGDVVRARMKGFAPWPALIVQPTSSTPTKGKNAKKPSHWVYFFGSKNYGWIEVKNIEPYTESKKEHLSAQLQKAFVEAQEYIDKSKENPKYVLELPPEQVKESEKEKEKEDCEEKFKQLVSPPKKPKKTPLKRQNSETSSVRLSFTKRSRVSSPGGANGISDVATELLNMPFLPDAPENPSLDLCLYGDKSKSEEITPSPKTFGFIGLGNIGAAVVMNLIKSGHRVNIYNRSPSKCEKIKEKADAIKAGMVCTYKTPMDIAQNSDVIICCVTDPTQAKEVVQGNCSVASGDDDSLSGKGYIEMTGIDPETSKDICEIISSKGGQYLEAQVQGSRQEAVEGNLVVLTAGDKRLFMDCQSVFKAMGKTAFFLGDVGYATKTNLILNIIKGIALVGLAEGFSLAHRCGMSTKDLLNIFQLTSLNCKYLNDKADMIVSQDFSSQVYQAIEHMQKDMKLALDLSDQIKQPLLVTSTANEVYKNSRRLGYDGRDAACVYMRTRY
ncbi:unnamed protein product [Callosobruchus maculatus]|uniref:Cytokine-like nuclear factor N-PAC n=1 Tax=Callosobruchus maculatus TaxID=64391 RepID=A0A653BZ41_CALMS|nr:unnamed protein product [Callosobruchus maculatus]